MAFGEVGTSLSKIKANSLNLAGTFGFTGTVSGLADETPLVLLSTFTSDGSDATASFTSGIDSTYKEYLFVFNNIHSETDNQDFTFNASVDNGSNYNVTKTDTYFNAYHTESDSDAGIQYQSAEDLAQGTGFTNLTKEQANDNDSGASGFLKIFNPSSTTFVKHYISQFSYFQHNDYSQNAFKAGYLNTTSAINAIQFKMSSGEIQGGTIDLFGVV
jgi:hypothetical protein